MSTDKSEQFRTLWGMYASSLAAPEIGSMICLPPFPEPEFKFALSIGRKWRFDWAWPDRKIAVEVEGNAWNAKGGGRHMQDSDMWKYNNAADMGWRVFRFSPRMMKDSPAQCVEMVLRALGFKTGKETS